MITIGIRATPKVIYYAIVDTQDSSIVTIDEIVIPLAFETHDALKYVRSNVLDILREYKVERAGVRTTEPSSQQKNIDRIQIEGVIIEAFASSGLKNYYYGQISTIAARIGKNRDELLPMIDGTAEVDIQNWADISKEKREAVLCAMGAEKC